MEESTKIDSKSITVNEQQSQKANLIKSQSQSKPLQQIGEDEFKFTDLNDINPIILLKKPNAFRQSFQLLFKMGGQQLQNQSYDASMKFYQKSLQLLDIGRNVITKDYFPDLQYMKIIMFANMACASLNVRKLQKCNKFCEKAIEEIEKFFISAEKQTFLKVSITLMVLKFQNCAILSQLQQHQRSLELCKSNLVLIKKYLEILDIFVKQTLTITYQKHKSNQTVAFSRQVYKFAAQTIKQLLEYIEQPMLKKQEMVFYYWEKNPQKNQEQLLKRFIPMENENCKRSILGVSKKNHWIDQFNIGSVMHMMPLKLEELRLVFPIEEYVFKDKLYEITIYCSMCYFTMATETRFIDSNMKSLQVQQPISQESLIKEESSDSSIKKPEPNLGNLKIMKKYGYSEKTEMYKRSEIYHLCSIDVMSRVIKHAIPYINHIIKSYQKHYIKEKKLEQINAIVEESFQEQDTIVNQSIAQYCPFDQRTNEHNKIQGMRSFSKASKNSHFLDSDPRINGLDEIQENCNKIIENSSEQQSQKITQKAIQKSSQQVNENSGEYLQSVVKKKKSLKNSRSKTPKQNPSIKQTKQLKRKIGLEKSPSHNGLPLVNPPKPPLKKKKS